MSGPTILACFSFIKFIENLCKIRYNGVLKGMLESNVEIRNTYKHYLLSYNQRKREL